LKNRINTELTCTEDNLIYIIERSIAEDRFVFVENMFRNGLLNESELEEFDLRRAESSKNVEPVNIFVYLRASPAKLKERIMKRGREMEKSISLEYLTNLNELYENKLLAELQKPESNTQVLVYDVNEMGAEEIAQAVLKGVEELVKNMPNRNTEQETSQTE
jgi:deoxyadenosine/deoxycytidine kinase